MVGGGVTCWTSVHGVHGSRGCWQRWRCRRSRRPHHHHNSHHHSSRMRLCRRRLQPLHSRHLTTRRLPRRLQVSHGRTSCLRPPGPCISMSHHPGAAFAPSDVQMPTTVSWSAWPHSPLLAGQPDSHPSIRTTLTMAMISSHRLSCMRIPASCHETTHHSLPIAYGFVVVQGGAAWWCDGHGASPATTTGQAAPPA